MRCLDCRRERRTESFLRQQLASTLDALSMHPRDPGLLLSLAQTTVEYRIRTGQGDLDRAIAACRAARDEWPGAIETLFWEARCQQLAGRDAHAIAEFRTFLDAADGKGKLTRIIRAADEQLVALRHAESR